MFAGDPDMVAFIQRAVGWSLTGVVKERALFFLYGDTGKNGKTTLVEAIMKLVGNCGESSYGYGRKVGADTFMKSKNPEDNQRKAATLAGPRFVCTSEVDEEHRLNEQLIKDITGGDTIEGRRLYQEAFTFKPQFKPWMYGNHKPEIRGTDDAIWSRVRLVPFEVSFKGREDLEPARQAGSGTARHPELGHPKVAWTGNATDCNRPPRYRPQPRLIATKWMCLAPLSASVALSTGMLRCGRMIYGMPTGRGVRRTPAGAKPNKVR